MVQVVFAGIVVKPSVIVETITLEDPGTAFTVIFPQLILTFAGEATTIPEGRLSVISTDIKLVAVGLSMVKVMVLLPLTEIAAGAKLLAMVGMPEATVKFAEAVPLFPALEVRSPVVLDKVPAVELVTFTEITQELRPDNSPLEKLIELPPGTAVTVPEKQFELTLGALAITIPVGKLSVKLRSVSGMF